MTRHEMDQSSSTRARKLVEAINDETGPPKLPCVALDFEELSQGQQCIQIRLGCETYTLRKTQSGKLILNK